LQIWETIVAFEYSFWVVCAILYFLEHMQLLVPSELVYEDTLSSAWKFRLSRLPFTIFNKDLYVLNPFTPWRSAFKANWGENLSPSRKTIKAERCHLLRFVKAALDLRVISATSFISLFILCPYVTANHGISVSLSIAFLINCLSCILMVPVLWFRSGTFRLTKGKLLLFVCEALLLPPYMACLLKRVSLSYEIQCDGLILAKVLRGRNNFEAILDSASLRVHQNCGHEGQPESRNQIQDYLVKLKAC
jgi:hypothetical protein